MTPQTNTETLPFLSSQERLDAYNLIISGCQHLWSKNKLQWDKAQQVLDTLIPLTKNDPYFLAHLTSYAIKNLKTKDLHVFLTFVSSLSSADGTPFSVDSEYKKPNLRYISSAALMKLDPKLALRVYKLMSTKFKVKNYLRLSRHSTSSLVTALKKYLKYRENNLNIVEGVKKSGLGEVYKNLYRNLHMNPSDEVASILHWNQKDRKIDFKESINFDKLTDLQIAEKVRAEKLPVLGVISALGQSKKKMSPVIAVAILEQATGNQAVILRKTFEDMGILENKEVMELYESKIKTAKTALDRAETLSKDASEQVKSALKSARAESRKEATKGLGKIYVHLDDSGSMSSMREFAIQRGSIIAECVNDPFNNFKWGMFGSRGQELPLPRKFEADAFAQAIFAFRDGGSTNCFALYPTAREFGADVDFFITDQYHTDGNLSEKIESYHRLNPDIKKPKACVIIDFSQGQVHMLEEAYKHNQIPVAVMHPDQLTQSALVAQSIAEAIKGPIATIDEIMNTELLKLPEWYYTI